MDKQSKHLRVKFIDQTMRYYHSIAELRIMDLTQSFRIDLPAPERTGGEANAT